MGQRPTLIEIARAKKGLTQKELGKWARVDPKTIVGLERRTAIPKVRLLVRLTNALELPLEAVLDDLYDKDEEAVS